MFDEEEKRRLVEHHLRLTEMYAKKYGHIGHNEEDLASVGNIGLIKAVNTFDPGKEIQFSTYASRCIENEMLMYINKNYRNSQEISIDAPVIVDEEGHEMSLSEILSDETMDVYDRVENHLQLQVVLREIHKLPGREKMIMEMRFGLSPAERRECTQEEIAERLGLSQSYVSKLEQKIIRRLRKQIIQDDS